SRWMFSVRVEVYSSTVNDCWRCHRCFSNPRTSRSSVQVESLLHHRERYRRSRLARSIQRSNSASSQSCWRRSRGLRETDIGDRRGAQARRCLGMAERREGESWVRLTGAEGLAAERKKGNKFPPPIHRGGTVTSLLRKLGNRHPSIIGNAC